MHIHNNNNNEHNHDNNNNNNNEHNKYNNDNNIYVRSTPSSPIKSLDFRGFDSSRLLILRGGNSNVRRIL